MSLLLLRSRRRRRRPGAASMPERAGGGDPRCRAGTEPSAAATVKKSKEEAHNLEEDATLAAAAVMVAEVAAGGPSAEPLLCPRYPASTSAVSRRRGQTPSAIRLTRQCGCRGSVVPEEQAEGEGDGVFVVGGVGASLGARLPR